MQSVIMSRVKINQVFRTLSEQIKLENVDTVELTPAILGLMRGGSPHTGDFDNTTDELIWVGGTTVGAELDEIWRESRGDWTHPIKDFYDGGCNRKNELYQPARLAGSVVAIDESDMTPSNLLAFCWVRNGELLEFVPRFIEPYADELKDTVVEVAKCSPDAAQRILQTVLEMNPVFEGCFDLFSVSAESEVARIIGQQTVNPVFLALQKFEVVICPDTSANYRMMGMDLPAHKLKMVFADFELSQEQLDARAALSQSKLSQLVIVQRNAKGEPVRYMVFKDLTPETVKFKHDAKHPDVVAQRTVNWLFMSMNERKEFPGEL